LTRARERENYESKSAEKEVAMATGAQSQSIKECGIVATQRLAQNSALCAFSNAMTTQWKYCGVSCLFVFGAE